MGYMPIGPEHHIHVYTMTGEVMRKLRLSASPSIAVTANRSILGVRLSDDDDDDGCVLIAGRSDDQLQVMTEQGELRTVEVQPPVLWPHSAVLLNNHLYVTSGNENTITKFTC